MAYSARDKEAIGILRKLGWRIRHTTDYRNATRHFQQAWLLGTKLTVDGRVGPLTIAAMRRSNLRHNAGKPSMSTHFSFIEFRCQCGGEYSGCQRIWVKRSLVLSLERYRTRLGSRVAVVSGCRCTGHNRYVGGASNSQHLYGAAADIPAQLTTNTVRGLRTFAGIGYKGSTGRVRHVDRRDVSGHNTTGGRPGSPTVWRYTS